MNTKTVIALLSGLILPAACGTLPQQDQAQTTLQQQPKPDISAFEQRACRGPIGAGYGVVTFFHGLDGRLRAGLAYNSKTPPMFARFDQWFLVADQGNGAYSFTVEGKEYYFGYNLRIVGSDHIVGGGVYNQPGGSGFFHADLQCDKGKAIALR
jgi:hypothetical protein